MDTNGIKVDKIVVWDLVDAARQLMKLYNRPNVKVHGWQVIPNCNNFHDTNKPKEFEIIAVWEYDDANTAK